jgi:hypothetical protein
MTYRRDLINDAAVRYVWGKLRNHPRFNGDAIRLNIYRMNEEDLQFRLDHDTPEDLAEHFLTESGN